MWDKTIKAITLIRLYCCITIRFKPSLRYYNFPLKSCTCKWSLWLTRCRCQRGNLFTSTQGKMLFYMSRFVAFGSASHSKAFLSSYPAILCQLRWLKMVLLFWKTKSLMDCNFRVRPDLTTSYSISWYARRFFYLFLHLISHSAVKKALHLLQTRSRHGVWAGNLVLPFFINLPSIIVPKFLFEQLMRE